MTLAHDTVHLAEWSDDRVPNGAIAEVPVAALAVVRAALGCARVGERDHGVPVQLRGVVRADPTAIASGVDWGRAGHGRTRLGPTLSQAVITKAMLALLILGVTVVGREGVAVVVQHSVHDTDSERLLADATTSSRRPDHLAAPARPAASAGVARTDGTTFALVRSPAASLGAALS